MSWQHCNYERVGYGETVCVSSGSGAYATYSFSFLVKRTSGALPRRPMRTTLLTSEAREGVDEKACWGCEKLCCVVNWRDTHASKETAWLTEDGEHGRRVQVWALSRGVTRSGEFAPVCASPQPHV